MARQDRTPGCISRLGEALRGTDDVGEQHGRQDAMQVDRGRLHTEEGSNLLRPHRHLLDLPGDTGQLADLGVRHHRRDVLRFGDRLFLPAMDEQKGRGLHRREHASHVGVVPDPRELLGHIGRAGMARRLHEEVHLGIGVHVAARRLLRLERAAVFGGAPELEELLFSRYLFGPVAPGIVRDPDAARHRLPPYDRSHPLRMRGCEQDVGGAGFEEPPNVTRSAPAASSTTSRSATRVSRFGGGTFRLDRPTPRRSCKISRENLASAGYHAAPSGSSHSSSTLFWKSSCQTRSGPSPAT